MKLLGQAELAAERPHLVLEQFAQRLDQLHVHALRQAADIVVRLDGDRRAAGERHALDDVGIERALRQELGAADLLRLLLEHLDEQPADGLALGLRIGLAFERADEAVGRVDVDQRDVVVAAEHRHHLLRLVLPHQAVVDEDAGQLLADRLVDQHRGDGGIDAARQAADDAALADLRADRGRPPGPCRRPSSSRPSMPAMLCTKLRSSLAPSGVCTTSGWNMMPYILRRRHRRRWRRARLPSVPNTSKPSGSEITRSPWLIQTWWRWPVAHRPSNSGQSLLDLDEGAAELAVVGALGLAAELHAHRHLAVADAEHRHAGLEHDLRRARAADLGGRGRAAGQDHRLRLDALEGLLGLLERHDLGIDAGLAHPPGDQLGDLAAEIDDEDGVGMSGAFHGGRLEKEMSWRNGFGACLATPIQPTDQAEILADLRQSFASSARSASISAANRSGAECGACSAARSPA